MRIRLLVTSALGVVLSSCGGSDGSTGGGGTSFPPTTSTPTPSYAPPPPNSVIYSFEVISGVRAWGVISLPTDEENASLNTTIVTDNGGTFVDGRGGANSLGTVIGGSMGDTPFDPASNKYEVRAVGYELASGEWVSIGAGPGATTVSAVNSLVRWVGSEDDVREALRVPDNHLNLQPGVKLATTSTIMGLQSSIPADVENANRIAAANVRLIAALMTMHILKSGSWWGSTVPYANGMPDLEIRELATFVRRNPSYPIFEGGLEQWLKSRPSTYPALHQDVVQAVSHLLSEYAVASARHNYVGARRGQYLLGVRAWLAPRLVDMMRRNDATTAAKYLAVGAADIERDTAEIIAVHPVPDKQAFFVAGTDVVQMAPGEERTDGGRNPGLGKVNFFWNDMTFTNPGNALMGNDIDEIVSISIPAAQARQIQARLNADQTITITAQSDFTGTSYFDYRVRIKSGREASGRVYVAVL